VPCQQRQSVADAREKAIIGMTIHFNAATVAHDEQCFTFYKECFTRDAFAKIITFLIFIVLFVLCALLFC
jgi:hypothetical protein